MYCMGGATPPQPCPVGTYGTELGASSISRCLPAPAGTYVDTPGSTEPSGSCLPGYYCPEGSASAKEVICPPGVSPPFQGTASLGRLRVEGTAGRNPGSKSESDCEPCEPGVTCAVQNGTMVQQPCPAGHYCPRGSAQARRCPESTYRGFTGGAAPDDCFPCPPGYFCAGSGLLTPSGACQAGFICVGSATTPQPTDGVTGYACTVGGYCPVGALQKQPCLGGTYNPSKVGQGPADCVSCPPGYYCEGSTSTVPTGLCEAGYICPGGASNPRQKRAPKGHYAQEGASKATACPPGTFNPNEGQAECTQCLPGYYCPTEGAETLVPCPAGSYCEAGAVSPTPCPEGTLSSSPLQPSRDSCRPCPPGYYCEGPGNQQVSGSCDEGFFCARGAAARRPDPAPDGTAGPCPRGTYCSRGLERPYLCQSGTYGASDRLVMDYQCRKCTEGFYCSRMGLEEPEGPCAPGYLCPAGSKTPYGVACKAGNYCPDGATGEIACPAGTFNWTPGAQSCSPCPAGYSCGIRTANYSSHLCPLGHYCPASSDSAAPPQCPAGTFATEKGLQSPHQCQPCRPGRVCKDPGLTNGDTQCPAGSYCPPVNTANLAATQVLPCPAGNYCPAGSMEPIICPAGKLCTTQGLKEPDIVCPGGVLCAAGSSSLESATACPLGYYCEKEALFPVPCPRGSYGSQPGFGSTVQCRPCPAGQYCDGSKAGQVTGPCVAGFYCPEGSTSPRVHICPKGKVCPAEASGPQECPSGYSTFADGASTCSRCVAGTNCKDGNVGPCEKGYYCDGVNDAAACPEGTYMPFEGATSRTACLPCPEGHACPTSGTQEPTACYSGYYCVSESVSPTPSSTLTLEQVLAVARGDSGAPATKGGPCPAGAYCPTQAKFARPCPPGMYCGRSLLTAPQGPCSAGSFCGNTAQSDSPSGPTDVCPSRTVGGLCPSGYYCPPGASMPLACPVGTLRVHRSGRELSACDPCPEGKYCPSPGLSRDAGACAAGFYCPERSTDMAENICPAGTRCGSGESEPQPCSPGTYQVDQGSGSCVACPAGFYCATTSGDPLVCPEGHYCPSGTQEPQACPSGTYRDVTGGVSTADCFPCPPGKYCSHEGTSKKDMLPCPAGYYCVLGAGTLSSGSRVNTPFEIPFRTPSNNRQQADEDDDDEDADPCGGVIPCIFARLCPANAYCPEGSWSPQPCPSGTGHTRVGATSAGECVKCDAGVYCGSSGERAPCDAGFICYGGALTARPTDKTTGEMCPKSHYCPRGTTNSRVCPIGTYGPTKGLTDACMPCPAGRLCSQDGLDKPSNDKCPEGSYCPAGAISARQCPIGTYNDKEGQADQKGCLACPPGHYCATTGLQDPSGECDEGTWCISGSQINDSSLAYLPSSVVQCPAGYTCAAGAIVPKPCPAGTYKDKQGAPPCADCPGGVFCAHTALTTTAADGPCAPGFYCSGGSTIPTPKDTTHGNICPKHKYCPAGSSAPTACPPGKYNGTTGMSYCPDCTAGFICSNEQQTICPTGGYCPSGQSQEIRCAAGTIGRSEGLTSQEECAECPAGKICSDGDQEEECPEGLLCLGGAAPGETVSSIDYELQSASFWSGIQIQFAGACPQGMYCPSGSSVPKKCPEGKATPSEGAASENECEACPQGYLCSALTVVPIICPEGSYCLQGEDSPRLCPAGTYQGMRGAAVAEKCTPCEAGHFCPIEGMEFYTNTVCPWGHYCLEGSAEPEVCQPGTFNNEVGTKAADQCKPCPEGFSCSGEKALYRSLAEDSLLLEIGGEVLLQRGDASYRTACVPKAYCPEGSVQPIPCPPNFYCPGETVSPIKCPANHYCPEETDTPEPCPQGYFCPGGEEEPFTCPPGSRAISPCEGDLTAENCCELCPAGTYTDSEASTVCSACNEGYICTEGSTTPTPSDSGGYICPAGYYCPAGAITPRPCSPGTYRAEPGGSNVSDCLPCPSGTYQRFIAMTSCDNCGPNSTEDQQLGAYTCTCLGENRVYQYGDKTCPCRSGYVSYDHHLEVSELEDGTLSCQPITLKRCEQLEQRDYLGRCIAAADCTEACGSEGGNFLNTVGVCECAKAIAETSQCDSSCKATLPTVTLEGEEITLKDAETGETTVLQHPDLDVSGASLYCTMFRNLFAGISIPCSFHFQRADASGLHALYVPPSSLWSPSRSWQDGRRTRRALSWARRSSWHANGTARKMGLENGGLALKESGTPQQQHAAVAQFRDSPRQPSITRLQSMTVDNSVICLIKGSSIVWELNDGVYPIYVQESLLNTGSTFDSTGLRALAKQVEDGKSPSFFIQTFEAEGTYVFASSMHNAKLSLVRVLPPGMDCPGDTGKARLELVRRYPTPIRLRPLSLLAISLLTSNLLLDPDWVLLVGLLLALVLVVLVLLGIAARFVRHRWPSAREPSTLLSAICLEGCNALAVRNHREPEHAAPNFFSRYIRPTGSTRILHYRIRDDLLDSTEQEQYDPVADVKPALDRLHVEIDIQDLRVVQATLEKLCDMRAAVSHVLGQEMQRERETCAEATQLVGKMMASLQERVDSAQLRGTLSISSRHVTALLRCILSALQGPDKRIEAEQQLKELEGQLQAKQGEEQPVVKRGNTGNKEAEILRACVAKAGPSVYDSLDAAIRTAKENKDSVEDIQEATQQFSSKATKDTEGQRHFMLASVYDLLLKRESKQIAARFKSLAYLHRHVDLAERRMKEKIDAFATICTMSRQDMLALQVSQNTSILEWQKASLIERAREDDRLLSEISGPLNRVFQEVIAELMVARDDEVPSLVNNLTGSVGSIIQQKCAKVVGNWTQSSYTHTAAKQLKDLKEQQEAQIKAKADTQIELMHNSLQTAHDAIARHSHMLAERERSALAKLHRAFKKEIRSIYAVAAEKATVAADAQAEALNLARKCKGSVRGAVVGMIAGLPAEAEEVDAPQTPLALDPERVEEMKKRALEAVAAAFARREELQKQCEALRLAHLEQRHQALQKFIGESSRLAADRARGAVTKILGLAETATLAEAGLGAPLLRHMGLSRAFEDLCQVRALPDSTRGQIQEMRNQQQAGFQTLMESYSKQFQVAHAVAVVGLKRINGRYIEGLKQAIFTHREETDGLAKEAAEGIAALHREDMNERMQLKVLVAQSISEAFLLAHEAEARAATFQKQQNFLEGYKAHQYDISELESRVKELVNEEQDTIRRARDEEESRLASEISAFEMLKAKEEELLKHLHLEQMRGGDAAYLETAATEVHEAEVQNATTRVTELLLQHSETKATAMTNISTGGASTVDADIADYCSGWEKLLAASASSKAEEMQRHQTAYNDRIRSLTKSQEANKASRRRQQLHVCHEIMELQQYQGPLADEKSRFMNELLRQLAVYQADVEFELEKERITCRQEEELRAVEAELEELDAFNQQVQQAGVTETPAPEQTEASQPTDGDAGTRGEDSSATAEGAQQVGEDQKQPSIDALSGEEANVSTDKLDRNADNETGKGDGEEGPETPSQSEQAAAEKRKQLEIALTEKEISGAHAQLKQEYRDLMRQAENVSDQERQLQEHRAQQLLEERRQRLLEKKARLQAEQQKALEELEKEKQLKLERLQQELRQDLVDFSIEFEVEPHELDKLARQLWTETHQTYQQQLREMEKRHAQAMEEAYESFINDWAAQHEGEADLQLRHAGWRAISRRIEDSQLHEKCELEESWQTSLEGKLKLLAAKGSDAAKIYLEETKETRRNMADVWKQRFEAIRQEQIAAQRAMEEKEAAYKAHVDERIKAVEAQWAQKLVDLKNEEWVKVQQAQELAEAGLKERRKMIDAAIEARAKASQGGSGAAEGTQGNAVHERLLNELTADLRQLEHAIQAEKKRQTAIYQGKLLNRMQRRRKRIINDAAKERRAMEQDALEHQAQLLSQQLHQQRFLFSRTKTHQVALKFSQMWLAKARQHLRALAEGTDEDERKLHELSEKEFFKRCARMRTTLAKSMKQVEILIRNLMPEKGSRDLAKGEGGASLQRDHESQAAQLKTCLQEVSKSIAQLNVVQRRFLASRA
ncbi:hypothetical protein, conserved [Eimeria brunetti]|uniref:GCC2 and GCC3 domain-containing protein n=1 Tax=Eimeria brunetti TaxID=51314 RepID=U6LNR5_9EIME|nr:hypothetical protein, conserved [Eimeria brunetti]